MPRYGHESPVAFGTEPAGEEPREDAPTPDELEAYRRWRREQEERAAEETSTPVELEQDGLGLGEA